MSIHTSTLSYSMSDHTDMGREPSLGEDTRSSELHAFDEQDVL